MIILKEGATKISKVGEKLSDWFDQSLRFMVTVLLFYNHPPWREKDEL